MVHRDPAKSNEHGLYSGVLVGANAVVDSDEERLVGRRFVPKGSMVKAKAYLDLCIAETTAAFTPVQ